MKRLARLARRFADAALQLTLPLIEFDLRDAPAAHRPEPPARTPEPPAHRPEPPAHPAAEPPPAPPRTRGEASRAILLRAQRVSYALKRSRRRTIGFTVDERGLSVSAPRWVGIREIEQALVERGDWILRKLAEFRELLAQRERDAIRWEHGGAIPFLGGRIELRVRAGHRGEPVREGECLSVALPPGAGADQLRDRVHAWLQSQAREHFAARVAHFSSQLGVAPSRWSLSSARTRWGSCNADGSIRLNWRLIHLPPHIVDYVICHELAHLRELNHGPRFWNTVGELFPEHLEARRWLRAHNEPGE